MGTPKCSETHYEVTIENFNSQLGIQKCSETHYEVTIGNFNSQLGTPKCSETHYEVTIGNLNSQLGIRKCSETHYEVTIGNFNSQLGIPKCSETHYEVTIGNLTPFGELKIYKLNGVGRPRGARLPSSICWQISIVGAKASKRGDPPLPNPCPFLFFPGGAGWGVSRRGGVGRFLVRPGGAFTGGVGLCVSWWGHRWPIKPRLSYWHRFSWNAPATNHIPKWCHNHIIYGTKSGVSGLRWPLYSGHRNWWRLKITFRMLAFLYDSHMSDFKSLPLSLSDIIWTWIGPPAHTRMRSTKKKKRLKCNKQYIPW